MKHFCFPILLLLAVAVPAGADTIAIGDSLDTELHALIKKYKLRGDPSIGRTLPSIDSPKAQLGKKLFYTTSLSETSDTACVSCHHPMLGGGDALSLPRGVASMSMSVIGPGRKLLNEEGGPILARNTPSTFTAAYFDKVLLWDGRVESFGKTKGMNGADGKGIRTPDTRYAVVDSEAGANLVAAQARCPVVSTGEMTKLEEAGYTDRETRKRIRKEIGAKVAEDKAWSPHFKKVFGDEPVSYGLIADALAAFQLSQNFVNTPWKRYINGDGTALSEDARQGAKLFYSSVKQGGFACVRCHQGDAFTDESFHVIGIPQIGRGMADGDIADDDFGRYRETRREHEKFAFRTPSLLHVEVTGPYGRTGAYTSLEGIIKHHLAIDQSLANYDVSQVEPGIRVADLKRYRELIAQTLEVRAKEGLRPPPQVPITDLQVSQLVAFLKSLTDPCVKDARCLAPWIAVPSVDDPDGSLRLLQATDAKGKPLLPEVTKQ